MEHFETAQFSATIYPATTPYSASFGTKSPEFCLMGEPLRSHGHWGIHTPDLDRQRASVQTRVERIWIWPLEVAAPLGISVSHPVGGGAKIWMGPMKKQATSVFLGFKLFKYWLIAVPKNHESGCIWAWNLRITIEYTEPKGVGTIKALATLGWSSGYIISSNPNVAACLGNDQGEKVLSSTAFQIWLCLQ